MKHQAKVCEFLDWDSNFFGYRIGRVIEPRLTEQLVKKIDEWVMENKVDCLYFLAEFNSPATDLLAQKSGFQLVDIRVTFEYDMRKRKALPEGNFLPLDNGKIRRAQPGDISSLKSIARVSYADSRFHFDQHFPKDKSDALYEIWIEKSCNGYEDVVLVAEIEDQAAGYISCKVMDKDMGQIGLVGVAEQFRGRGIGKSLIYASLDWFAGKSLRFVTVVTQGRNISAQRLYQNCGFITRSIQLWYHRWTPG